MNKLQEGGEKRKKEKIILPGQLKGENGLYVSVRTEGTYLIVQPIHVYYVHYTQSTYIYTHQDINPTYS